MATYVIILSTLGGSNREFGFVYIGEENVVETVVNEGLVEVVHRKQNKDVPEYIHLCELEEAAKQNEKGKWATISSEKREVLYEVEEPARLVNKDYQGIIEYVRDGSTLRVALELEPKRKYQMITLMISGIKCPPPEDSTSIGDEAKFYTECRLLHRDVNIRLEQTSGGSNSSAFVGSVSIGKNNIAEYLLREGMAKCIDWTLALVQDPVKYREAEREAKLKKIRIWKDYQDQKSGTSESYEARVVEVINGDALKIQPLDNKKEKKIFLASIRPPRLDSTKNEENFDRKGDVFRALYDIPYMFEAREYLRKRLIGKKVKVTVDYVQPKTEKFDEKVCCTVLVDNVNIGEALISRGLASLVKYRPDDESRASSYDTLLAAEIKAQKSGKGIFGNNKDASGVRIVDLSNDQAKAKGYLPFLQRTAHIRKEAVVEYVYSASRIKVYIPKENCLLNLILVGITTPKKDEPFAEKGKEFLKKLTLQKDVQLLVESMDKLGNFIGTVFTADNKNLALELIKNGLAQVRDLKFNDLVLAENEAKKQKIGIWQNYKEEETVNTNEAIEDESNDRDISDVDKRKSILITQISDDATTFFAQNIDDGQKLEELLSELREELKINPPLPGAYKPKAGDNVVAKFSVDQQWYRAKVLKVSGSEVSVVYVDYGNREVLSSKNVAAIPLGKFSPLTFPPAAKEYSLAFVRVPQSDPDLVEEARSAISEDTADKVLLLKAEYRDSNNLEAVTLLNSETKQDIGLNLVRDGFFLIDVKGRERRFHKVVNEYKTAQEYAKKSRVCITFFS